jgi:hypothetical protein
MYPRISAVLPSPHHPHLPHQKPRAKDKAEKSEEKIFRNIEQCRKKAPKDTGLLSSFN